MVLFGFLSGPLKISVFLFVASAILLSHNPDVLLHSQLWAEDGAVWLRDAYELGWKSLFIPHTGYLQTFPRLVALFSLMFPLSWAPTVFAIIGFFVQMVPIALLLSDRAKIIITYDLARYFLIFFYISAPNLYETFVVITDAQWHLAIITFLLIELPTPKKAIARWVQNIVIFIQGLTGPFCIFLMFLSWWRTLESERNKSARSVQSAVITISAIIQLVCIVTSAGLSRPVQPLGASIFRLARIVDNQLFMMSLVGTQNMRNLASALYWQHADAVPFFLFILFFCLLIISFFKGPVLFRRFFILGLLILAASLISPVGSLTNPLWIGLEIPGAGSRYYLIPTLVWFSCLMILATDRSRFLKVTASLLILISMIGVRADWNYTRQPETGFVASAQSFEQAPPGRTIIFHEAPTPSIWMFSMTKK